MSAAPLNDIQDPWRRSGARSDNDRTVLAIRYGYLRFRDDFVSAPSDAGTLGFAPAFAAALHGFPNIGVTLYNDFNGGARTDSTFYSQSVSASLSRLAGRHTFKVGGDYRQIGMRVFSPGSENGTFVFSPAFTGPNPNAHDNVSSAVLGGWALTGVGTYQSGFPVAMRPA